MKKHPFSIASDVAEPPEGFTIAARRFFTLPQFLAVFPGRKTPGKVPENYEFPSEPLPRVTAGRVSIQPGNPVRFFANYYKPADK